jgi:hypothetical protein
MDNVQKRNICTYYLILKISIFSVYYVFNFRTHNRACSMRIRMKKTVNLTPFHLVDPNAEWHNLAASLSFNFYHSVGF